VFPQSVHLHESMQGRPCLTQEQIFLSSEQPDLHPQDISERMASKTGDYFIHTVDILSLFTLIHIHLDYKTYLVGFL